jgi:hypothetical protein
MATQKATAEAEKIKLEVSQKAAQDERKQKAVELVAEYKERQDSADYAVKIYSCDKFEGTLPEALELAKAAHAKPAKSTAELTEEAIIKGLNQGIPEEETRALIKQQAQPEQQETSAPPVERYKPFEEMSPELQAKATKFYEWREMMHREITASPMMRGRFEPQTLEQFIKEFETNPKTRKDAGGGELLEGVIPVEVSEITDNQWDAMYEGYRAGRSAKRIETLWGFKEIIKKSPEKIPEFLTEANIKRSELAKLKEKQEEQRIKRKNKKFFEDKGFK